MKKYIIFILLLTSCSNKIPFTKDVKEEYNLTEENLKQIQFYTSEQIVLRNKKIFQRKKIEQGKLNLEKNNQKLEVIIPEGTPCVLQGIQKEKLKIKCDKGKKDFFVFAPSPNREKKYKLAALKWDNKNGVIEYNGKKFYTDQTDTNAFLKVDIKEIERVSKQRRYLDGITIKEIH